MFQKFKMIWWKLWSHCWKQCWPKLNSRVKLSVKLSYVSFKDQIESIVLTTTNYTLSMCWKIVDRTSWYIFCRNFLHGDLPWKCSKKIEKRPFMINTNPKRDNTENHRTPLIKRTNGVCNQMNYVLNIGTKQQNKDASNKKWKSDKN